MKNFMVKLPNEKCPEGPIRAASRKEVRKLYRIILRMRKLPPDTLVFESTATKVEYEQWSQLAWC